MRCYPKCRKIWIPRVNRLWYGLPPLDGASSTLC
jgi:hypothetical protein